MEEVEENDENVDEDTEGKFAVVEQVEDEDEPLGAPQGSVDPADEVQHDEEDRDIDVDDN